MNTHVDESAYLHTRAQRLQIAKDLLARVKSPLLVAHMAAIVRQIESER